MNVVDITTVHKSRERFSLQYKSECYQWVWRELGKIIDPFEQVILLQLIDRTIGWGNREAYFTARQVLKGDATYAGIKVGRTKFYEALARLEAMDLVRRRHDPHVPDRVHYTVNVCWTPEVAGLPTPVQPGASVVADPARQPDTPVRDADNPVRQPDTIASINKPILQASIIPGATAPVSFSRNEKVREKKKKGATGRRAGAQASPQGSQAFAEAVEAAWRQALIATFPGTAYRTWGVREKAQINRVLRSWRGDFTFPDFVTWAVTNWTAIMRKQFKWMTRETPPAVPVLSFLIAFLTQFADCRAEGVLEDWLSADDRTQLERMMGRGQTYDQAMAEIARQKAIAGLRKETAEERRLARVDRMQAEHAKAQAVALANLNGSMPIHPDSREAKRLRAEAAAKVNPQPRSRPTTTLDRSGDEFAGAEVFFVNPNINPFDV